MKIVNLFALFQNPTRAAGWQVWGGDDLVAVFATRAQARKFVSSCRLDSQKAWERALNIRSN
jgi:hypothetical protein